MNPHQNESMTPLDSLQNGTYAPGINVRGQVDSITRLPFYCNGGSHDAAMGFKIMDPQSHAQQDVFVFARDHNLLPRIRPADILELRGATVSVRVNILVFMECHIRFTNDLFYLLWHDGRFGNEIRASPHTGGEWNVWTRYY
ncbi:hypothetical protein EDD21DRAFT_412455 [Dissophora ornata]|nr:hypothetical protein EDD21DRAFT_412455 [Dissophora ornata]